MRGFWGIGIYRPKIESNMGTLWRSAYNFGASFIFTIGRRYQKQNSDTIKAWRHLPLYHFENFEDFNGHRPHDCPLVIVEQCSRSKPIATFKHPERAIYLLGAEDGGVPEEIWKRQIHIIQIDTPMCLNVAVAGSIVMFHRQIGRAT